MESAFAQKRSEKRLNGINPAPRGMSVTVDFGTNRLAGKRYDGRDRVTGVSNPYGTTTNQAPASYDYWTNTTYDALGRPVTVTNPDNTTRTVRAGLG
ncbi:MAG: RHS repeat protein [Acidobacteria bacterium]|nr:RHS repeat protein [Acidobacteriota bacterium]